MLEQVKKRIKNLGAPRVGIDLGTTNTVFAVYEDSGPRTVQNEDGTRIIPSVVSYDRDGSILVGEPAKNNLMLLPESTISSSKRYIGRSFDEEAVRHHAFNSSFQVRGENGKTGPACFEINGKLTTPQQVAAEILKKGLESASESIGSRITKATISVPAYFTDVQRQATKDAGEIAGLKEINIISEPTAAALAHLMSRQEKKEIKPGEILGVIDLGGGTFDVSFVKGDDEGNINVVSSSGAPDLGGDDFDEILLSRALSEAQKQFGVDLTKDLGTLFRVKTEMIRVKHELSTAEKSTVSLPFLCNGKSLNFEITRDEFNSMITPVVGKMFPCIETALENGNISKKDVKEVIFVGGSTRVKLVQSEIEKFFPHSRMQRNQNCDEVVAWGAAIRQGMEAGTVKETVKDCTAVGLGVWVIGDRNSTVIKPSTALPASFTKRYYTTVDNQEEMKIRVIQGDNSQASSCKLLGEFLVEGVEPAPAGEKWCDVTLSLSDQATLEVKAIDSEGREKSIQHNASDNLKPQEITEIIAEVHLPEKRKKSLHVGRSELSTALVAAKKATPVPSKKLGVMIKHAETLIEGELNGKVLLKAAKKLTNEITDHQIPEAPKTGTNG